MKHGTNLLRRFCTEARIIIYAGAPLPLVIGSGDKGKGGCDGSEDVVI